MNRRKIRKLLRQTFRIAGANRFMLGYLIFFVAMAFALHKIEPSINGMKDSFWYCFEVATTVGFGDIAAISFFGLKIPAVRGWIFGGKMLKSSGFNAFDDLHALLTF